MERRVYELLSEQQEGIYITVLKVLAFNMSKIYVINVKKMHVIHFKKEKQNLKR